MNNYKTNSYLRPSRILMRDVLSKAELRPRKLHTNLISFTATFPHCMRDVLTRAELRPRKLQFSTNQMVQNINLKAVIATFPTITWWDHSNRGLTTPRVKVVGGTGLEPVTPGL